MRTDVARSGLKDNIALRVEHLLAAEYWNLFELLDLDDGEDAALERTIGFDGHESDVDVHVGSAYGAMAWRT